MTTTTTRLWTFATVIIVIVLLALGWFLGVSPQLSAAAVATLERQNVATQNVALRAATDALAADFAAIDELREQLSEVEAEFPPFAEYDDFVETILVAVQAAGLTLNSAQVSIASPLSVDAVPDEEGLVAAGTLLSLPVSISVFGDVRSALVFADALQRSERFTFVNVVSFSEGTTGNPATVVSVRYYMVSSTPISVDTNGEPVESEGDDESSP